jgi:carboxymethylenebutenolidase
MFAMRRTLPVTIAGMNSTPFALAASLALLAAPALAQDWALARLEKSPRHGEWVALENGDRTVQTFVVYPESKAKSLAVIAIHENRGLTDWARGVADQLAEAGYIALAPDLLSGTGPQGGTKDFASTDAAREAISKLTLEQVTGDLDAVAAYARKLPASNGKLAVSGFCWGGGQAFRFATHDKGLAAAFVFYGAFDHTKEQLAAITAPVYGFYAGNDERIGATIPATTKLMQELGKRYEPVTYAGAAHAFMRGGEDPQGTEADRKAREQSWERWKTLLKGL